MWEDDGVRTSPTWYLRICTKSKLNLTLSSTAATIPNPLLRAARASVCVHSSLQPSALAFSSSFSCLGS